MVNDGRSNNSYELFFPMKDLFFASKSFFQKKQSNFVPESFRVMSFYALPV